MTTQDCENLHPLLSLYLEDKLSEREKARVAQHVSECEDARAQMEEYRVLRRLLLSAPEPVPPADLHERILDHVYATPESSTPAVGGRERLGNGRSVFWGLAAAIFGLVLFFNLFSSWRDVVRRSTSAPEPVPAKEERQAFAEEPASGSASDVPVQVVKKEAALPQRQARIFRTQDVSEDEALLSADNSLFASQVTNRALSSGLQSVAYGDTAAPRASRPMMRRVTVASAKAKAPVTTEVLVAAKAMDSVQPSGGVPVAAVAAAPSAAEPTLVEPAPAPVEGKRWSGVQSSYPEQHTEWVQDPNVLTAYWQLLGAGPAVPEIDFQKDGVALIFLGTRPTGGYSVSVDGIAEGTDAVTVLWHEQAPAMEGSATQAVTRPWALQTIPRTSKPVVFIKR